jgi:LytS/YehU family sensor histidine kinase
LQAQVEPHFLYNTLANLRYLVQKNSPDALRMTDALIEYLRTSVPDMRAQHVTLGREVEHARHYLEIMQMRMGGRLAFRIDVPAALGAIEIPPLVLLTLVENAVKHGIAPRVEGGEVLLSVSANEDALEIEVADTGAGVLPADAGMSAATSTGVGLENLRERLRLAYGRPVPVDLAPNQPRGTRVRMRIPRTRLAAVDVSREPADEVRVMTAAPLASALLVQEVKDSGR